MLVISGSDGEGGGQIVRSSLALSVVTGRPITIKNIRAGRSQPGLRPQHVAAVQAAAQISRAALDGAEVGSDVLQFLPKPATGGDYRFAVGTAGSATLVLQTVLPALLMADAPSRLILEGGTHNPWAPPFDFLEKSFLPVVNRMGPEVSATLDRPGFYPAGGGRFTVEIRPSERLQGIELLERAAPPSPCVRVIVADLPGHIAQRECEVIQSYSKWPEDSFVIEESTEGFGPGNVVLIELNCGNVTEVITGFGKKGVMAERIATDAWLAADQYLRSGVPVGEYLADQLLLPLGISAHTGGGGGTFRTTSLSRHATTHIRVLKKFLDIDVDVNGHDGNVFEINIRSK
jgi:RNA 3'-terminal phosphate cyclase (ATP)